VHILKACQESKETEQMIELMPIARQYRLLKQEILAEIADTLDHGKYILGPKVQSLENKIVELTGSKHAVAVANGTDALVLTLDACGIGPGDEVITTPYTFFATSEAISRVGATPIYVDIEVSWNLDPKKVEAAITSRTKAILPVHLFGQPARLEALQRIADEHGLLLLEDACQAFGALYRDKHVGTIGKAGCFSFFPSKNLGTMGDGGLILTSDSVLAERLRELRQHGSAKRYFHNRIGYNSRLDEIHAAILLVMLNKIEEWIIRRRALALRYDEQLAALQPLISLPCKSPELRHAYNLYCIRSPKRDLLRQALLERNIQSGVYYPCPLHLQEAYKSLGYKVGDFPEAELLSKEALAIPMGPLLTEQEQDSVISALRDAAERLGP
jgi:dTDP-4-amino-4,6-dideoxygalactose transaminase